LGKGVVFIRSCWGGALAGRTAPPTGFLETGTREVGKESSRNGSLSLFSYIGLLSFLPDNW
jgi:hypothetical protein